MSSTWKWVLEVLAKVLIPLLGLLSPEIKKLLNDFLVGLYQKALATPNPWDDFAVGLLLDLFGIPRPPPVS